MTALWIPGNPAPQPRPRVTMQGRTPRVYYVGNKYMAWREAVTLWAQTKLRGLVNPGTPKVVSMWFCLPARNGQHPGDPHAQKPDLDNLVKVVLDALIDAEVLDDDSQVVGIDARKQWSEPDQTGVDIEIREA